MTAWFQKDDFAWLGLRLLHQQGLSLAAVLFTPFAQGTVRTLSERIYYLSLTRLFGINPLPFHVIGLLTFAAATVLIQLIGTRLTTSQAAGWAAAMLWTVNAALATPLAWSAVYYELLCAVFFLLDVWLLLRFLDTGKAAFFLAQWTTFLIGFLVLEINVVYPALALAIVWCVAPTASQRSVTLKILPMFAASAIYTGIHLWAAPLTDAGPYKLYWDAHIPQTLLTYLNWSLGTGWLRLIDINSGVLRLVLALLLAAGLIAYLLTKLREHDRTVLLYPAWFVIVLSPLLPLRFHMQYEYLTVPVIGLALWAGAALVAGYRSGASARITALVLLTIYLAVSIPIGLAVTTSFHDRSLRIRDVFTSIPPAPQDASEHALLFKGVNSEIFNDLLYHRAFRLVGFNDVHLLSENLPELQKTPLPSDAARFFLDPAAEQQALAAKGTLVYDLSSGAPADVTAQYRRAELASSIQTDDDSTGSQLGPSWYPKEAGYRWMPKQAIATLHNPTTPAAKLYITGYCPKIALQKGPIQLTVNVDGEHLNPASITKPDSPFQLAFDLPASASAKPSLTIQLEVDHTFHAPGDTRDLGIIISSLAIR